MRTSVRNILVFVLLLTTGIAGCKLKSDAAYVRDAMTTIAEYNREYADKNRFRFTVVTPEEEELKELVNDLTKYSVKLKKLDVSNCPEDFRKCYKEYTHSITKICDMFNKLIEGDLDISMDLRINHEKYERELLEAINAELSLFNLARNKYNIPITIQYY